MKMTLMLALVLGLGAVPSASSAQQTNGTPIGEEEGGDSGPCTWTIITSSTCNSAGQHFASYSGSGNGGPGNGHGSGCYVCGNPPVQSSGQAECHPCSDSGGGNEPEAAAYRALMSAASLGNVSEVLTLAAKATDHVLINHARSSVQILSCDKKDVIGNIPLNSKQLAALEMSVKQTGMRYAVRTAAVALLRATLLIV